MDGFMSLSGLRPWPEQRLAEFGRRQYYGVEAGSHDAQGRIARCAQWRKWYQGCCALLQVCNSYQAPTCS
jgi:hypothetical protein